MTHSKHVETWRPRFALANRPLHLVPFAESPVRVLPFSVIHAITAAGVALGFALALVIGG